MVLGTLHNCIPVLVQYNMEQYREPVYRTLLFDCCTHTIGIKSNTLIGIIYTGAVYRYHDRTIIVVHSRVPTSSKVCTGYSIMYVYKCMRGQLLRSLTPLLSTIVRDARPADATGGVSECE